MTSGHLFQATYVIDLLPFEDEGRLPSQLTRSFPEACSRSGVPPPRGAQSKRDPTAGPFRHPAPWSPRAAPYLPQQGAARSPSPTFATSPCVSAVRLLCREGARPRARLRILNSALTSTVADCSSKTRCMLPMSEHRRSGDRRRTPEPRGASAGLGARPADTHALAPVLAISDLLALPNAADPGDRRWPESSEPLALHTTPGQ
jgi:hypothetical protein